MAYRRSYNRNFGELGVHVAKRWPERSIIEAKGKQKHTLGLAVSGGGYRSAIFNYGILKGLHEIGVIGQLDYLSAVSGGSWIATPFSTSNSLRWFFDMIADHPNLIEEGFEALLANPLRVAQEAALSRRNPNYVSNVYGRLLARTFLREQGQESRYKPLADKNMIKNGDRPFLIINGTVSYRSPRVFSVTQEGFEMTQLYSGSRTLGYIHSKDVFGPVAPGQDPKALRVRDAIAISGAAVAVHLPALGAEVAGIGLGREVLNYARENSRPIAERVTNADFLDLSDGGHYNNLGVEVLINRGCKYIIIVDAEHDPETKSNGRSNQTYHGLRTLLQRQHIRTPLGVEIIEQFDEIDKSLHVIDGAEGAPDVLYIKLKSSSEFNEEARQEAYNQPDFLTNILGGGEFSFDPQFSTAKLDYDFAEHRNLSELGTFIIKQNEDTVKTFIARSE